MKTPNFKSSKIYLMMALSCLFIDSAQAANTVANKQVSEGYIFVYKDKPLVNLSGQQGRPFNVLTAAEQLVNKKEIRHTFSHTITGFSANVTEKEADIIMEKAETQGKPIAYKVKNTQLKVPEPAFQHPPALSNGMIKNSYSPWNVQAVYGPKDGTKDSQTGKLKTRNAWIIDTGIDRANQSVNLNIGTGADCSRLLPIGPAGCKAGPNEGQDDNGHGTHVAGIIAGLMQQQSASGVVGVAYGATVHPIKVMNMLGFGWTDDIIAGVDYVAQHAKAGDCVNMSLGGLRPEGENPLDQAIINAADKGVLFAIAAGNDNAPISEYSPADLSTKYKNIYVVGATDANNQITSFSNYGTNNFPLEWFDPGQDILSLKIGGGLVAHDGTSMAAPHMCAILMMQGKPAEGVKVDQHHGQTEQKSYLATYSITH